MIGRRGADGIGGMLVWQVWDVKTTDCVQTFKPPPPLRVSFRVPSALALSYWKQAVLAGFRNGTWGGFRVVVYGGAGCEWKSRVVDETA